jgi:hypothetical protein
MEKYKSQLEEWRHRSNTRKMKKRQKESHLGRKKEGQPFRHWELGCWFANVM